jgi:hypothetical protein
MKTAINISKVLSWINIVFWGYSILEILMMTVATGIVALLIVAFFFSAMVLHSYAALKLRKSILHPEIPLGSQTPVGIRFIGLAASFFGMLMLLFAYVLLGHTTEYLALMKSQSLPLGEMANITPQIARKYGVVMLLLGLCIIANVYINLRLLKWYYTQNQKD